MKAVSTRMKHLTSYNIRIVLFASVGSLLTGYLSGTSGQSLGQASFYETLGLSEDPTSTNYAETNRIISTANGLFYAGGFFGSILTGFLARRLGPLVNLRICASVAFVGTIIQAVSVDQPMYLVSRFITGMGSAQILAAMPPYYSEIADPKTRGLITGMQGIMLNVGYAIVAFIGFGCFFFRKNSFGWRFPVAFGCFFCILLFIASFLLPQSPRFLVAHDRNDEALAVLLRLHGASVGGDDFARRELAQIRLQFDSDKEQILEDVKWQIVTKKTYLKRVLLALMVLVGSQDLGILVIFNYQVILFKSLGISAVVSQMLPGVYELVATLGNLIGASTSDWLGRRKALLTGFVANLSMFITFTGLLAKFTETGDKAYANGCVAFIFLYVFFFGSFIDPNQFTLVSEIFPSHLRSMGMGIGIAGYYLINLLWTQVGPVAISDIGWRFYLVFVVLGVCHITFLFFFLPDTTNLPLEEIDALFGKEPAAHMESLHVEGKDVTGSTMELE